MKSERFGRKLRDLRLEAEVNLRTLADAVGIAPARLEGMESGQEDVSLDEYILLCTELGVPYRQLLMDEDGNWLEQEIADLGHRTLEMLGGAAVIAAGDTD